MRPNRKTRRQFLKESAGASSALLLPALFGLPSAHAATVPNPVTLVVFLRGAADPLSVFPLLQNKSTAAEWAYFTGARPNIRVQSPLVLNSTAKYGLHPGLSSIHKLWQANEAAMLLGAGSLNVTRSHFNQMAYIEGGDPANVLSHGYLNRALSLINPSDYVLQGLALQPSFDPSIPLSLRGSRDVQAVESIEDLAQLTTPGFTTTINRSTRVNSMFANGSAGCSTLTTAIHRDVCSKALKSLQAMEEAKKMVTFLNSAPAVSAVDLYSRPDMRPAQVGSLAAVVQQAAKCIYSQPLARFVTVDFGSFDTHNNQGSGLSAPGHLDYRLTELDFAIGQFVKDAKTLGFWSRTTIVIMSEFGRTIRENATGGTDHGRGGMAMILAPASALGSNKFFAPAMLLQRLADPARAINSRNEITDPYNALPVAYDLRRILTELLIKRHGLAATQINNVFPNYGSLYSPLSLFA